MNQPAEKQYKITLSILYPIRMLPTTLVEDSPNNHRQSSASNIHMHTLVFGLEKNPHVDPMNCLLDNL
jgi:hypothetical protein